MQQSYFDLLNLEPRFALRSDQLDLAYRALAARVHPDRHAHSGAAVQREAMMLATHANDAYRTLKKPVLRAQHLLRLRGVETDARSTTFAPGFLMEQMELRESLDEAKTARNLVALNDLYTSTRNRAAVLNAELEMQLDVKNDALAAAESVHRLMFIEKLIADIDDARAKLED
jgi:molecular chaperone HscB